MVLTILYPTSTDGNDSLKVDIVAVHGLDGEPTKTWTDPKTKAFWIKDYLPQDIPDARILNFGYNARAAFGNTTAQVIDHAKDLLSSLLDKREEEIERRRPLIFIAHSLGGIIVKQALAWARIEPQYRCLEEMTIGILFFGTPHRGTEKAAYGAILAKIATTVLNKPNPSLLNALQTNSNELMRLSSEFKFRLAQYQVVSFYELKPMAMFSTLIVEKHSALLEVDGEDQIPVDANHSDICKFPSRKDQYYEKCYKRILRMLKSPRATELTA